jgi:hypothetical protein
MGEARFSWCSEVLGGHTRDDPVLGMIVFMPSTA